MSDRKPRLSEIIGRHPGLLPAIQRRRRRETLLGRKRKGAATLRPGWTSKEGLIVAAFLEEARPVLREHFDEQLEGEKVDFGEVGDPPGEISPGKKPPRDFLLLVMTPPIEQFDGDDHSGLAAWLMTCVANLARDAARKVRRTRKRFSGDEFQEEDFEGSSETIDATDEVELRRLAFVLFAQIEQEPNGPELLEALRRHYDLEQRWDEIPGRTPQAWKTAVSSLVKRIAERVSNQAALREFFALVLGLRALDAAVAKRFFMPLELLRARVFETRERLRDKIPATDPETPAGVHLRRPEVALALAGLGPVQVAREVGKDVDTVKASLDEVVIGLVHGRTAAPWDRNAVDRLRQALGMALGMVVGMRLYHYRMVLSVTPADQEAATSFGQTTAELALSLAKTRRVQLVAVATDRKAPPPRLEPVLLRALLAEAAAASEDDCLVLIAEIADELEMEAADVRAALEEAARWFAEDDPRSWSAEPLVRAN